MVTLRARITLANISSQMVQVLGFIRLGRMPNMRNGTESTPRSGTGICICCQHPLQIRDWCGFMKGLSHHPGFPEYAIPEGFQDIPNFGQIGNCYAGLDSNGTTGIKDSSN